MKKLSNLEDTYPKRGLNLGLFVEEEFLRRETDLFLSLNRNLLNIKSLDDFLKKIANELSKNIPFHYASLNIWDKQNRLVHWNILWRKKKDQFKDIRKEVSIRWGEANNLIWEAGFAQLNQATIYDTESFDELCEEFAYFRFFYQHFHYRSIIWVPLQLNEQHQAHLILASPQEKAFVNRHLAFLTLGSPQIALAVENQLAVAALQLREQRKELQFNVIQALTSIQDRSELILTLAKAINRLVPCDEFNIKLLDKYSQLLNIGATALREKGKFRLLSEKEFIEVAKLPKEQLTEIMHQMKKLYEKPGYYTSKSLGKICDEFPITRICCQLYGFQSTMYIPVFNQKEWIATLILASRSPRAFSFQDIETMQELASNMPLAIANMYAFEQLQLLKHRLEQEKSYLAEEIKITHNFDKIIGQSLAWKNTLEKIKMVAPLDTTVLILGETGTGKELIARTIHSLSDRSNQALIKINCAVLPAELIESELFGHEKGAFTGAIGQRIGKFELANEGTIFLDEIGELPIELQVKLLRVIQEKELERIGGQDVIKINVRIIAATNRNLEKEIQNQNFRQDLFYRLNVFPIKLAPLRERKDDIPLLVEHFLQKMNKKLGKKISKISKAALKEIQAYHWPGNIRELEHVIEHSSVISQSSTLELANSLQSFRSSSLNSLPKTEIIKSLDEVQRAHIIQVLEYTNGKIRGKGGAAELLKIKPSTLESRMKKLGIQKQYVLNRNTNKL